MRAHDLVKLHSLSLACIRVMAKTAARMMREASLKIVGTLRIRARAPAVIAPRAWPMSNIVAYIAVVMPTVSEDVHSPNMVHSVTALMPWARP